MKVYRYMSFKEFDRMSWGEDIVGKKNFAACGFNSTSKGVCFLPALVNCKVFADDDMDCYSFQLDAVGAFQYLIGIVSSDILVEFEAEENIFNNSTGIYCSPIDWRSMEANELCIDSYNRNICKPLRYCVPDCYHGNETPTWWECH